MKTLRITSFVLIAALAVAGAARMLSQPLNAQAQGQSGTTLTATASAVANYTKTFHWTIDKSVTPDAITMFTGDSADADYTIAVTKDAGTTSASISGQVCVTNGGAVATENLEIIANLTMPPSQAIIGSINVDLSAKPVLNAGDTYCYPYEISISNIVESAEYKVTADVTITNHSGHLGEKFGPNPSATTILPASPTLINDTINVDDTNGGSWVFSAGGSQSYSMTFTCDQDEGQNNNTATIRQTGQSDSASVTVNCYALEVTKDAATSFTRSYDWDVAKTSDVDGFVLQLTPGQTYDVNYSVTVNMAGYGDSHWAVAGTITVHNPAPMGASITAVSDVVSPAINADVDCGVSFPYTLASGGDLVCSYSADLPDASTRTNTATATLQNTPSGTTDFSGTADVSFAEATMAVVDECVNVSDLLMGDLGTVCIGTSLPKTYNYTWTVGPYTSPDGCGEQTVGNTAYAYGADSESLLGFDDHTVFVFVTCQQGCTLTQGYWKTHSEYDPAPYDDTWALLPDGADTPFYNTSMSWHDLFWTPPAGGNAYIQLAHQYMAARLNVLNGADNTSVAAMISHAEVLFGAYDIDEKLSKAVRQDFLQTAGALADFNEGETGPGHCSENGLPLRPLPFAVKFMLPQLYLPRIEH